MPVHESCAARAERLNRECRCQSLDRAALRAALACDADCAAIWRMIEEERPHLFSDLVVYVGRKHMERMAEAIAAIESVVALPAYREHALERAPAIARREPGAAGIFLGYDFHLGSEGPRLIEINTNAGGAMLLAGLTRAQRACCLPAPPPAPPPEEAFLAMFREEWRRVRGDTPLSTIAIVDDDPDGQFLYPEFALFARLFERAGLKAIVCDPKELEFAGTALRHGKERVDLVYNRVTDFALEHHSCLRAAYEAGAAVITPHPRAHALYADKGNLVTLSDERLLRAFGVDEATRTLLLSVIPRTEVVAAERAEDLWRRRKGLFFKPAAGFGSKAAYRGDKLTKRVFGEILAGDYVAQALALPGERTGSGEQALKVDLRHYVYGGRIQLSGARLYQGQTTNFRTPGGGFAPLVVVDAADLPAA